MDSIHQKRALLGLLGGLLFSACGPTGDVDESPTVSPTPAVLHETEPYSGGETTLLFFTETTAYASPAANLSGMRGLDFEVGDSFFSNPWVTAPSSTTSRDGLGPTFNANACASCHADDGRGAPPTEPDELFLGLLLRLSITGPDGEPMDDPNYGGQFQHRSIQTVPSEGHAWVEYIEEPGTFADGTSYSLRHPVYGFDDLNFGELSDSLMVSPRVAPSMIGLGLLQAVEIEDILALSDEDDWNGDGISGKANFVWNVRSQQFELGRFGWKANQPTLEQQNAGAFNGDIGITSSLFPEENCPSSQSECVEAISGGTPELSDSVLEDVTFYTHLLAVPVRRDWDQEDVIRGKRQFIKAGCMSCHVETLETGEVEAYPELSGQTIHPYTDLLVHDMGDALADNRPDGMATGTEWRTPPLWGIGLLELVNNHTYLMHDGRARGFEEAILWHGGEAQPSADAYSEMEKSDRDALLAFLRSL